MRTPPHGPVPASTPSRSACSPSLLGTAHAQLHPQPPWSSAELDEATERLRSRGLLDGDGFSDAGRADAREVEVATDAAMRPAIEALGADLDELVGVVEPWSAAVCQAGGYLPTGPHELARAASTR